MICSFIHLPETAHNSLTEDIQAKGDEKQEESNGKNAVIVDWVITQVTTADADNVPGHGLCRPEWIDR